jgi:hypothetical protein
MGPVKLFVILLLFISLFSCATTYQETGFTGGFSETQLASNVFKVNFKGNAFVHKDKAADFALLRSAELTLDNGFNYFIIHDSVDSTNLSAYSTNSNSDSQTYIYNKPASDVTIECFVDEPETNVMVFEAEFVKRSIRSKYKLDS